MVLILVLIFIGAAGTQHIVQQHSPRRDAKDAIAQEQQQKVKKPEITKQKIKK